MPFPGSDQQSLSYRVEIDRSSLSETVAMIRESVGQAMTDAVQMSMGASGRVLDAAAIATSRAQGVGSVIKETTQGLTSADAVTEQSKRGSATMSLMQAAAIRSGMADPGFSQTRTKLNTAANARMSDFKTNFEEGALSVTHGVGSVLSTIGSVATLASLFPPAAPIAVPVAAIADAGAALVSVGTMGWERTVERERFERALSKYGKWDARAITKDFEQRVRMMGDVNFGEATMVARSALANMGTQYVNQRDVANVLAESLNDWRAAGKLLGADRSEALAVTGELYRMGVRPGDQLRDLFAVTAATATTSGANAMALHQAGMQFGTESAARGYGLLAANMQFQIQTGALAEATRMGLVDRATLTTAAGFSGPVLEQQMAAATNMITEGRRLAMGTGYGRLATAGILAGGSGDLMSMGQAAAGMSLQQMLEAPALASTVDPAKVLAATTSQAAGTLKSLGQQVTNNALVSTLMQSYGMNESAARQQAMLYLNPEIMGRQQARMLQAEQTAFDESVNIAGGPARVWRSFESWAGDTWRENVTEGDTKNLLYGATVNPVTGLVARPALLATWLAEKATGSKYRGFGGVGTAVSDLWDVSGGELLRDIGDVFAWDEDPTSWVLATERGGGRARGAATMRMMTKSQIRGMTRLDFNTSMSEVEKTRNWVATHKGLSSNQAVVREMGRSIDADIGQWLDDNSGELSGIKNDLAYAAGGEWNRDKVTHLMAVGSTAIARIQGAKPGTEAYDEAIEAFAQEIQTDQSFGVDSIEQARKVAKEFVGGRASKAFSTEQYVDWARRRTDMTLAGMMGATLGSDQTKKDFAGRFLRGGASSTSGKAFMRLKDSGNLETFFSAAMSRGEISRDLISKAQKSGHSAFMEFQLELAAAAAPEQLRAANEKEQASRTTATASAGAMDERVLAKWEMIGDKLERLVTTLEARGN